MWKSANGNTRFCFPVVLGFQVDYPESCQLTLVRQGRACPRCMATKSDFGNLRLKHEPRTVGAMLAVFERAKRCETMAEAEELCQQHGLVLEKVCNI
jgi:hypothetical protein